MTEIETDSPSAGPAEPAWPTIPAPGHAFLVVSPQELDNILARVSADARKSLLYIPGEGAAAGRLQYPESCAEEILAIDRSDARPGLTAYARDRRWRAEVSGITVAGVPVATDDRSKMMIIGARVAATADPAWRTVWHGSDGQGYPVDAAAMVAISDAVQAHVNATFTTLSAVLSAIEAGEITTQEEIEAAFA